jgi:preprotein translocase subunit SecG
MSGDASSSSAVAVLTSIAEAEEAAIQRAIAIAAIIFFILNLLVLFFAHFRRVCFYI